MVEMIRVAGINKNDMVNGEGVSVSLFLQGCPFHCKGCHNPETWNSDGGDIWNEEDLTKNIIEALTENNIYRNLSILGGEPLDTPQKREYITKLIKEVKKISPEIKICIWTGYLYETLINVHDDNMKYILNNINYLIDGEFKIKERDITLKWRGSRNQRIIDMKNRKLV